MSKKDNFSQAMFEMFGLGKAPEEKEEPSEDNLEGFDHLESSVADTQSGGVVQPAVEENDFPTPEEPEVIETPPEPVATRVVDEDNNQASYFEQYTPSAPPASSAVDSYFEQQHHEPVKRANCTYFAEGTSMEGTLRCDSDVEICGDFKGEIASDGRVTLHSNTASSIAAAELVLIDCSLVGDSMVSGDVTINDNSTVTGNIRSTNLTCSGIIKGNLNISGNITLTENAQIIGDIKTGTLMMSRGAKVSGKIDMGIS